MTVRDGGAIATAVLKPPHSKRFAKFGADKQSRQRLECGGFSTAVSRQQVTASTGAARPVPAYPRAGSFFSIGALSSVTYFGRPPSIGNFNSPSINGRA